MVREMWWLKRVGVAVCLVSGVLAVGVVQPVLVGAAPVCQGPVTAPCVVVPGLVAEPVLTAFPGYPSIPVNFALAPDGKIFVADKSGRVLVYGGRGATTWSVVADLRGEVHDFWDRGVLGIAVDPQYASGSPYVYVLYTYDKDPMTGQGPPRWGSSAGGDGCPNPPGGGGAGVNSGDGCVVTARISRFPVDPATGSVPSPCRGSARA